MQNYIQQGDVLTLVAPAGGVESGQPLKVGGVVVVPKNTAAEGENFTALWKGMFNLPKVAADTPTQLQKAYFKADTAEFTTVATGNSLAGVFAYAGAVDQTQINVLLTGQVT